VLRVVVTLMFSMFLIAKNYLTGVRNFLIGDIVKYCSPHPYEKRGIIFHFG